MIGKLLGNRYEILEKIGGGGMALVYKAKCRLLNRYVAVKVLRPEFTNDEEFIDKFRKESQAAASLSHHNIVNIYDVGSEGSIYYIVMEYIKGKTLKKLINEKGKLEVNETIEISIQIAEALNHAHKNHIVHRDIKPHNIMVTDDGKIKVTDFGIARAATSSTVTNTSNVIGSVHYFSPEQARGGYTDAKSDIYSLGIVMYEMMTGRVPFQGESPISVALKHIQEDIIPPREIDKNVPENMERIIRKAVQKDQSLRYNSAEEILEDLRKVKNGKGQESIIEFKDYNDSPTLVMPAVKEDVNINENRDKERRKIKKNHHNVNNNKRGKSRKITMLAIITAFIFSFAIAFGYFALKGYLKGEDIIVPDVEGLEQDVAKMKLENEGLKMVVKAERNDDTLKEGYIIEQMESPGNKVAEGFPIEVIVSKGVETVKVPDLLNLTSNEAIISLNDLELEGEVSYENSEYPIGTVINQDPSAYEEVPKNTKVSFTVSNGPKKVYITMPNVVGLTKEKGESQLRAKGFEKVKVEEESNEEYDKGIIFWQSFPSGEEVEENITINLKISSGLPIPDENNEQNENGDENSEEVSEEVIVRTLTLQLPSDKEKYGDDVKVKIEKEENEERKTIYEKTHKLNEGGIKVPVSGKGKVKVIIYFDDEYITEKEIEL
ncbi:Stk1 family PASTA domain-containing Ser/Thr kinase [Clostridiisalibacter paucivorans]|uniref:Stk1 family PASTA domain-containing Ser/Thr kinase n=1 Tax=Clostridiisalibacter paucivorans TaxID=408753 RepID=UPI00047D7E71|nr:Stk1 family PASTA domain-containing Ser/Thr kinase [Clostridiisalibacter paucivorans]